MFMVLDAYVKFMYDAYVKVEDVYGPCVSLVQV